MLPSLAAQSGANVRDCDPSRRRFHDAKPAQASNRPTGRHHRLSANSCSCCARPLPKSSASRTAVRLRCSAATTAASDLSPGSNSMAAVRHRSASCHVRENYSRVGNFVVTRERQAAAYDRFTTQPGKSDAENVCSRSGYAGHDVAVGAGTGLLRCSDMSHRWHVFMVTC